MADLMSKALAGKELDSSLAYLLEAWQEVPRIVQEIESWDVTDQAEYVLEWAPKEELLTYLARLMEGPLVTDEQRARFRTLQELVERYRPVLTRLLKEP